MAKQFESIADLTIHSKNAYEHREYLKLHGCKWDAGYRAWIAPTVEDRNRLEYDLEFNLDSQLKHSNFGRWEELEKEEFEFAEAAPIAPVEGAIVTKEKAVLIVGEGNCKRYWDDLVPAIVEHALLTAMVEAEFYQQYDGQIIGRTISLAWDLVKHFRLTPPIDLQDEAETSIPPIASQSLLKSWEMDGKIAGVIDTAGGISCLRISFPYCDEPLRLVKGITGRKWNSGKKSWEIPLNSAPELFRNFPHFQRSGSAEKIYQQCLADNKLRPGFI